MLTLSIGRQRNAQTTQGNFAAAVQIPGICPVPSGGEHHSSSGIGILKQTTSTAPAGTATYGQTGAVQHITSPVTSPTRCKHSSISGPG